MDDVRCTKCGCQIKPTYECACRAPSDSSRLTGSVSQRLIEAEDILSDLSTGFWVSTLDDADVPVNVKMGQRVLNYWKKQNVTHEPCGKRL